MAAHLLGAPNLPVGHDGGEPLQQHNPNPRTAYGLPVPARERAIDEQGYELTKHSLRFRGEDWDIVLNSKREELRAAFIRDAAAATGEPESNIVDVRHYVDEAHRLIVRFNVRHRAQTSSSAVQDRLATYPYEAVRALYEPRVKKPRKGRTRMNSSLAASIARQRWPQPALSCYGHAVGDVGPNGLEFRDKKEQEEVLDTGHDKMPEPQITTILA
ncbi:uncharacterized protein Tco025E_06017 [Trypanosoma conorhini]|uniref:Flagellar attachment zone protein 1 conserved domain-containing protein n=1 Tax=Trypanosoma conorhini TaxID=83891 RepID=A0A422P8A6_9TRYP|nr:uncharacterized protein Tco025E_06017 [Trypanosoma conorhini]RNF13934.1 hypothetical protein Tco025E_06017 [Trypanosoma conorhini]